MQTLILDAAGSELVKRVLKLCSSSRHSVKGKFIDIFLESAVDAGNLTAAVPSCVTAEERRKTAQKALDALKKTTFLLGVAEEAEYFLPRRVKAVFELASEIEKSLKIYAYGQSVQPSRLAQPVQSSDSDGFNDDYIG